MLTSLSMLFRRAGVLCVLLAALALANAARADDMPTFSDPEVNAFVKAYSEFTDQYEVAAKASKTGDNSKMMELSKKMQDIQTKAATVGTKVKPDELQKFSTYMQKCIQRISDAAKALTEAAATPAATAKP